MIKTILLFALPILIGAGLGALLGSTRSCETGACPLTATPWRGALYGGVMGLLLALSGLRPDPPAANAPAQVEEEEPAPPTRASLHQRE